MDSDPQGAEVFLDGKAVGRTPYAEEFHFYGVRRIELRHPRYVRLVDELDLERPWWQVMPIGIVTDLLWPFPLRDQHDFRFELTPRSALVTTWADAEAAYHRLLALEQRERELDAEAARDGIVGPPVGSEIEVLEEPLPDDADDPDDAEGDS